MVDFALALVDEIRVERQAPKQPEAVVQARAPDRAVRLVRQEIPVDTEPIADHADRPRGRPEADLRRGGEEGAHLGHLAGVDLSRVEGSRLFRPGTEPFEDHVLLVLVADHQLQETPGGGERQVVRHRGAQGRVALHHQIAGVVGQIVAQRVVSRPVDLGGVREARSHGAGLGVEPHGREEVVVGPALLSHIGVVFPIIERHVLIAQPGGEAPEWEGSPILGENGRVVLLDLAVGGRHVALRLAQVVIGPGRMGVLAAPRQLAAAQREGEDQLRRHQLVVHRVDGAHQAVVAVLAVLVGARQRPLLFLIIIRVQVDPHVAGLTVIIEVQPVVRLVVALLVAVAAHPVVALRVAGHLQVEVLVRLRPIVPDDIARADGMVFGQEVIEAEGPPRYLVKHVPPGASRLPPDARAVIGFRVVRPGRVRLVMEII